jgi:hypothetical protein
MSGDWNKARILTFYRQPLSLLTKMEDVLSSTPFSLSLLQSVFMTSQAGHYCICLNSIHRHKRCMIRIRCTLRMICLVSLSLFFLGFMDNLFCF